MFYEIRFPSSISFNSTSTIQYNTNIVESKNGKEQRLINRNSAKILYNINIKCRNDEEIQQIIGFFRIVKGSGSGFRFKDWTDYKAINQHVAVCDGDTKQFQLFKSYVVDNKVVKRKITKIVNDTIKIYLNNVDVTDSTEVNTTTGIVTFVTPPNANDIFTANFEFDVPVRFYNDDLNIEIINRDLFGINNLKLLEIL